MLFGFVKNCLCSRYRGRIADRMNEDYAFIMYNNHPSYREIMEKIKKTSLYLPAELMKRLKIYCI